MPNKYDKLAGEAQAITDAQFKERFSSLTTLNDDDIGKIISTTGISKKDLAEVVNVISGQVQEIENKNQLLQSQEDLLKLKEQEAARLTDDIQAKRAALAVPRWPPTL